jgi:hypothetical protein
MINTFEWKLSTMDLFDFFAVRVLDEPDYRRADTAAEVVGSQPRRLESALDSSVSGEETLCSMNHKNSRLNLQRI